MADITSTLAASNTFATMAAPAPTPPTAVFTPDPGCVDPSNSANYWVVTTSCYLNNWDRPGAPWIQNSTPDWLRCSVSMFGVPEHGRPEASTCFAGIGYPVATAATNDAGEQEGPRTFYGDCPVGYAAAAISSGPGYGYYSYTEGSFDISAYVTTCCPTAYPFQAITQGQGQSTYTSHDGRNWPLFVYPMPGCYATSIQALSGGKELPMQTTSNTQVWDKRQEAPEPTPAAVAWDYEGGTMYALAQYIANTVFMGTQTCYENCDEWLPFYYPDGTGAPGEPNTATGEVKMARPSETGGGEENNPPPPPTPTPTHDGEENSPPPTPSATHEGEENSPLSPTVTATNSGGEGESTPSPTASGSGSQSGDGDSGNQSSEPAEPTNSQSPDVSLASRFRGEFTVGSCSIVALMIPLLVATLVL
ncbi:hypothetical protein PG991_008601 [Apiospora marii]|uniref:Uncharacterized protein n=1 Tax=Apiospora marii TaxID=335849 RepID=A0ABR1RL83_9PEZI